MHEAGVVELKERSRRTHCDFPAITRGARHLRARFDVPTLYDLEMPKVDPDNDLAARRPPPKPTYSAHTALLVEPSSSEVWFVIDIELCSPIKSECLDKLVPLGERHLRVAISEVFASRIGASNAASCASVCVRTVLRVPTGMNTGVAIASRAGLERRGAPASPRAGEAWIVNFTPPGF